MAVPEPQRTAVTPLALAIGAVFVCLVAAPVDAQWQTRTITLRPGWNAVFLDVQPEPADPGSVFDGLPVETVWMWNRDVSLVQFIQDASTLVPQQPDWLLYNPEVPLVNTLFAVRAGNAYLINIDSTEPVNWEVVGRPHVAPTAWVADSYNLIGLRVDTDSPPTFAQYFAASPAHGGFNIHRLTSSGQWQAVANPAAAPIVAGEAYWIFCKGSSAYPGPLRVDLEQGGAVDFGRVLTEQIIRITNHTTAAREIELRPRPSSAAPLAAAAVAGDVPLSYWSSEAREYVPLTGATVLSIPGGGDAALRVAVRRPDMAPDGSGSALYQSLIEVRNNAGAVLTLPVVAKGLAASNAVGSAPGVTSGGAKPGLWVGSATIDEVSEAAAGDRTTATASPMQIRLIVHVDAAGQASLLQQVTLLWRDGTTRPDPEDPEKIIVGEPGRFVLVTRDDLLSRFSGAALRRGRPVGRRISSAAFSFAAPLELSGAFGSALTSAPIVLGHQAALNPFKHRYHPDHDNLGFDFTTPLAESYTVTRTLRLTFRADDPDGLALPGWGDTQMGGSYEEDIDGLHRELLHVAGTFRLHHVSPVAVLNDGF